MSSDNQHNAPKVKETLATSSDKDDIFDFAMKHCCDIFLKLIYTLIELNFFCFSRSF